MSIKASKVIPVMIVTAGDDVELSMSMTKGYVTYHMFTYNFSKLTMCLLQK
ncbi:14910_t:CDS:2 [Rhizophagus irregularis]|nr:14910_t:CDS:2 [Rhizophagus irregularis]